MAKDTPPDLIGNLEQWKKKIDGYKPITDHFFIAYDKSLIKREPNLSSIEKEELYHQIEAKYQPTPSTTTTT